MPFAQQLTKKDASGTFTQVGCGFNDPYVRSLIFFSVLYQVGGWAYGEDRASALWNSEEGVQALQFLQDWYHKWQVEDPTGLAGADAFGNGQAPLFLTYGYYAGALDSRYPTIANKWDAVFIPTFTGTGLPAWGLLQPDDGFVVSSWVDQEKKDAAFAFIKETSTGVLFAAASMRHFPLLPVEEERRLHDPMLRENFIERIFVAKRWRDLTEGRKKIGNLIEFHARHKLLVMAHSPKHPVHWENCSRIRSNCPSTNCIPNTTRCSSRR